MVISSLAFSSAHSLDTSSLNGAASKCKQIPILAADLSLTMISSAVSKEDASEVTGCCG